MLYNMLKRCRPQVCLPRALSRFHLTSSLGLALLAKVIEGKQARHLAL